MAVVPIRKLGDPVLRSATEAVTSFDKNLRALVKDMIDTMYAAPGIGLAANQIGVSRRVAVIDLTVGEEPDQTIVMINPQILERRGEVTEEEGCLSVPEFTEMVMRSERVKVRFQDLEGKSQEMEGEGLLARAFAHEIDHLNGSLYIDYLRGLKKERILKKIQKLTRAGEW